MNEYILKLKKIISNSENIVFFGGAGVSTESGIPDFRSRKGIYMGEGKMGLTPEELVSYPILKHKPELFFRFYKEAVVYPHATPNKAHKTLAKMETDGKLACIITQNIDGLHQAAGSKNVAELHGSNARQYCQKCKKNYTLEYILNPANCDYIIPKCPCGGIVRPDVVLFGEQLDGYIVSHAISTIQSADCIIVGGTSLAVYPAAGLLGYMSQDCKLVVINRDATPLDNEADLVIGDSIGQVLSLAYA